MRLPLYQIDAFASQRFAGNPAAVCPLDAWPDDALLQSIANENNLSETAFFVREGDGYRLRWFTPTHEVELCGHATLAAAHVIATRIDPAMRAVTFASRSGPLTVRRDGRIYELDFPALAPAPVPAERALDGELAAALGARPAKILGVGYWCLAVFEDAGQVAALAPDMARLGGLAPDAVIATAPGTGDVDFVSRCFVPKLGIPEDPVTGSAHCVLTPYWVARLGRSPLNARQISTRGGALTCALKGARVTIAGEAVPYLEGWIDV